MLYLSFGFHSLGSCSLRWIFPALDRLTKESAEEKEKEGCLSKHVS